MERHTMFMDLKTQYSKDASSSQIDLVSLMQSLLKQQF